MEEPPIVPTPPVSDVPYAGPDRRATDPVTQAINAAVGHVKNGASSNTPTVTDASRLVIAGVVIALQFVILISQFRLADRQSRTTSESARFRGNLTCFLVEFSKPPEQQRRGTDLLTACGFLQPTEGK